MTTKHALRVLAALLVGAGVQAAVTPAGAREIVAAAATASPSVARDATCQPLTGFDSRRFSTDAIVSNRFFSLVPGTQLVLRGVANVDRTPLQHFVVSTVTSLTKVVSGVRTTVVWDVDISAGLVVESELAFFAQDFSGNVWLLGEYPEEYQNGVFIGTPNTWIAGQSGATAGIQMMGSPSVGASYLQASAPEIDLLDCAEVVDQGQHICVPVACYDGVLVTDETSPLAPVGGIQRKFYAPGVGNLKIEALNDPEGESLALIQVQQGSTRVLTTADASALELDRRAYRFSPEYRFTRPAERRPRPPS